MWSFFDCLWWLSSARTPMSLGLYQCFLSLLDSMLKRVGEVMNRGPL